MVQNIPEYVNALFGFTPKSPGKITSRPETAVLPPLHLHPDFCHLALILLTLDISLPSLSMLPVSIPSDLDLPRITLLDSTSFSPSHSLGHFHLLSPLPISFPFLLFMIYSALVLFASCPFCFLLHFPFTSLLDLDLDRDQLLAYYRRFCFPRSVLLGLR